MVGDMLTYYLAHYQQKLIQTDYLNDWRALKLEREVWRSLDTLTAAKRHWHLRQHYYTQLTEPQALINKVST